MARTICKWTTILAGLAMVAGIVFLVCALVTDSHYDPNAVVRDSNGFETRGAHVSNSTWAWVGGITLGVATPLFMIALFGWVFSALASGGRKLLGPSLGTMGGPNTTAGWASANPPTGSGGRS